MTLKAFGPPLTYLDTVTLNNLAVVLLATSACVVTVPTNHIVACQSSGTFSSYVHDVGLPGYVDNFTVSTKTVLEEGAHALPSTCATVPSRKQTSLGGL